MMLKGINPETKERGEKMKVVIFNRTTGEYLTEKGTWMVFVKNARKFNSYDEASAVLFEMFGEDRGYSEGIRMEKV